MLALTDLGLHSTFDPYGNKSAAQLQQEIYKRVMPYAPYPGDRQIYSFSHIFAGGYSAGYYRCMFVLHDALCWMRAAGSRTCARPAAALTVLVLHLPSCAARPAATCGRT